MDFFKHGGHYYIRLHQIDRNSQGLEDYGRALDEFYFKTVFGNLLPLRKVINVVIGSLPFILVAIFSYMLISERTQKTHYLLHALPVHRNVPPVMKLLVIIFMSELLIFTFCLILNRPWYLFLERLFLHSTGFDPIYSSPNVSNILTGIFIHSDFFSLTQYYLKTIIFSFSCVYLAQSVANSVRRQKILIWGSVFFIAFLIIPNYNYLYWHIFTQKTYSISRIEDLFFILINLAVGFYFTERYDEV
jgi:hypothetical protein